MRHGWMVEVLEDLREYANKNNLVAVYEALKLTSTVVEAELEVLFKDTPPQAIETTAKLVQLHPHTLPAKYQA